MTSGQEPTARDVAVYTAVCDSRGYRVMRNGIIVKVHRLEAICYQLTEAERVQASAEFATYDIIHGSFMLS